MHRILLVGAESVRLVDFLVGILGVENCRSMEGLEEGLVRIDSVVVLGHRHTAVEEAVPIDCVVALHKLPVVGRPHKLPGMVGNLLQRVRRNPSVVVDGQEERILLAVDILLEVDLGYIEWVEGLVEDHIQAEEGLIIMSAPCIPVRQVEDSHGLEVDHCAGRDDRCRT